MPARVVGRGLLRPLPDNTASVAIWLGAGKPSREGDLTRKKSLAQAENEPIVASMPLPDDAKNKYVAPGMSAFTTATIEDMSETSAEQKYRWELLAELDLPRPSRRTNQAHSAQLATARRRSLRRILARAIQDPSLSRQPQRCDGVPRGYYPLGSLLSQTYQAYCILDMCQGSLFRKRDGSVLERLNILYGRAKHVEKAIATVGLLPENGTLAIWLTNDGLRSTDSYLTFGETAEILRDLARFADALQDPLTMKESSHRPETRKGGRVRQGSNEAGSSY